MREHELYAHTYFDLNFILFYVAVSSWKRLMMSVIVTESTGERVRAEERGREDRKNKKWTFSCVFEIL